MILHCVSESPEVEVELPPEPEKPIFSEDDLIVLVSTAVINIVKLIMLVIIHFMLHNTCSLKLTNHMTREIANIHELT